MYESVESRNLKLGPGAAELPVKFVVMGSDDHATVFNAVLLETSPTLFGLTRTDLQLDFKGGQLCFAELSYTSADPSEALQPEGGGGGGEGSPGGGDGGPGDPGGGDGGPGGESPQPQPGQDDPLDANTSFSTGGGTAHILLSLETKSATAAEGFIAADTQRAIGLTKGSVEGCDIVTSGGEYSVTRKRRQVTLRYLRTLLRTTGKTNKEEHWGFQPGELLYLGAEGSGSNLGGWTITHKFRFAENNGVTVPGDPASAPENVITPQLKIPSKNGHDYVWCIYQDTVDQTSNQLFPLPIQANVERVYREASFTALEIGGVPRPRVRRPGEPLIRNPA